MTDYEPRVQARSVVIDSSCSQLASLQPRLTRHTGADMVHTPASWEQGTKEMIAASRGIDSIHHFGFLPFSISPFFQQIFYFFIFFNFLCRSARHFPAASERHRAAGAHSRHRPRQGVEEDQRRPAGAAGDRRLILANILT